MASQGGTLYPHSLNCRGAGPRLTQWAAVVSVGGACPTCRAPAPSPSTPNRKHGFCVAKPLITVCLWGQPMSRTSLRGTHTKLLGLVGPPCWLWQERCSRPPRSVAPPACHPSALEAAAPSGPVGRPGADITSSQVSGDDLAPPFRLPAVMIPKFEPLMPSHSAFSPRHVCFWVLVTPSIVCVHGCVRALRCVQVWQPWLGSGRMCGAGHPVYQ